MGVEGGRHRLPDKDPDEHYFERAGIYAEFGKVICISAGIFVTPRNGLPLSFRIKSFSGDDECGLLTGFGDLLNRYYSSPETHILAGHNIREFDIPFLCRRMLVTGCALPRILDISGRKPWDVNIVDTMQLWKFGDFKNFTSLRLMAALFNLPTPKNDIDGSDVARVYWKEQNMTRIVDYCRKDVLTVAQLILKFRGQGVLSESEVAILDN